MMAVFVAFLAVQDPASYRATLTLERHVKREDRVSVDTGELLVRPGEALLFQSRQLRVLLRGAKAFERRSGERTVKAWDLSKVENFQPLDLWRLEPRAVQEHFQELDDPAGGGRELPPSVVGPEGRAIPPVVVRPSAESLAWTDGVDHAEGCKRIILVPRDPKLRSRISSIRLSVDRATGRLLRAVVDSPAQVLTLTLGDCQAASLDDAAFDWDFSNLKVEDR